SPSNSMAQPRMKFPKFLIRDLVASQHKLLTEHLGINHVVAVIGPSMGGMQTLQWGWRDILNFLAARSPEVSRDQFDNPLNILRICRRRRPDSSRRSMRTIGYTRPGLMRNTTLARRQGSTAIPPERYAPSKRRP